jgi:hypothetical protein
MNIKRMNKTLLFVPALCAAVTFLAPTQARADYFINVDIKYEAPAGSPSALGISFVFAGNNTLQNNFFNGCEWWPNGELAQPFPAPCFSSTEVGPADPQYGGSSNTMVKWSLGTSPDGGGPDPLAPSTSTMANGVHVGATLIGAASGPNSLADVYFRDASGNPIPSSDANVVGVGIFYRAPSPSAPPPSSGLPSQIAPGQFAEYTLGSTVASGSQVVFYHQTTGLMGDVQVNSWTASTAPAGGPWTATIRLTNNTVTGKPAASAQIVAASTAQMSTPVALQNLNPSNAPLMQQISQNGIPIIPPNTGTIPALPPWALALLGCGMVGTAALLLGRRRFAVI